MAVEWQCRGSGSRTPQGTAITALERLGWRGDPGDLGDVERLAAELDHAAFRRRLRRLLPPWVDRAACAGQPVELFFPERGASNTEAMTICNRCPVRQQCLTEALADPSLDHGIRGGASARTRRAMRRDGAGGSMTGHTPTVETPPSSAHNHNGGR